MGRVGEHFQLRALAQLPFQWVSHLSQIYCLLSLRTFIWFHCSNLHAPCLFWLQWPLQRMLMLLLQATGSWWTRYQEDLSAVTMEEVLQYLLKLFRSWRWKQNTRCNTDFVKMSQSSDFETVFHFLRPQFFPPKTDLISLVLVGAIWTRLEDRKMNWISRMSLERSWSCYSPISSWKCTKSV